MGTVSLTPEVKRPVCEVDYSRPPSAEVKDAWNCNNTAPYVFMAWQLINY